MSRLLTSHSTTRGHRRRQLRRAPSLSFLSSFPGILAVGELIKESLGQSQLRGSFEHVLRYGPNSDQLRTPGFHDDCTVGCRKASKLAQYRVKYPFEGFDHENSVSFD
jgi:hypothetical protein